MSSTKRSNLGHHIDLLTGYPFKSELYTESEASIALLRGDNVIQGAMRWDGVKRWPIELSKGLEKYLLHEGDFVIAMDRTWVKSGLKAAIVTNNDLPCLLVQRVARLRPKPSLHPYFLSLLIRSHDFEQYVKGVQTETAVPHISPQQIRDYEIALPPLPEQTAIASLLSTWDFTIEKTERLIAAKEKGFSHFLRTMIDDNCGNWKHLRADKIFKSVSEKGNGGAELLSVTQDRGVIPRTMLEGRVMSPEGGTDSYKLIKKGDFAISLRSFQGGIEYSQHQGLISPAYTVLRPKVELHDEFYRHFFKSYLFIQKYLSIAVIGIRDGKQISIPDFMTVKIPLPPIEQQKQIAALLNTAQEEIDLLNKQADALRRQKRGLMQKLLTGEWRVRTDKETI